MFVTIDGVHINLALVGAFSWGHGKARLVSVDAIPSTFPDPEKKLYKEMCEKAGVQPLEEV